MPVMKITVTFTVPDAGSKVLKRCAWLLERPFHGFLKNLVERQDRWAPRDVSVRHMDLAIEIEATEGERTWEDLERSRLRETGELLRRLRDRGLRAASVACAQRVPA